MAKGDYIIFNNVDFQSVTSHPRRYGVMFDPSSSRSRLRIRDSGRRFSVRLQPDGTVEYRIDGEDWKSINPLKNVCIDRKLPAFLSHEKLRIGEALNNVTFDMIAVGRGRIIGKEAGTDRLFHVYMSEMFRTQFVKCNVGENTLPLDDSDGDDIPNIHDLKDIAIPPFNMKIDPEYFTEDPPTVIVPPESTRAALEETGAVFPIFSVTRYPNFVRRAFPDAPVPSDFTGELGDAWRYDFDFDFAREVEERVRRFCTTDGHIEFGTSLWFEDVVGHRSLAQELVFA